jgi:hypothetical protein
MVLGGAPREPANLEAALDPDKALGSDPPEDGEEGDGDEKDGGEEP